LLGHKVLSLTHVIAVEMKLQELYFNTVLYIYTMLKVGYLREEKQSRDRLNIIRDSKGNYCPKTGIFRKYPTSARYIGIHEHCQSFLFKILLFYNHKHSRSLNAREKSSRMVDFW